MPVKAKLTRWLGAMKRSRQMVDILTRRRQNNPLLTGKPASENGSGEGLALRIADGDVPEPLQKHSAVAVDIGMRQAGC